MTLKILLMILIKNNLKPNIRIFFERYLLQNVDLNEENGTLLNIKIMENFESIYKNG